MREQVYPFRNPISNIFSPVFERIFSVIFDIVVESDDDGGKNHTIFEAYHVLHILIEKM